MKKFLSMIILLLFASTCLAADFSAKLNINTGNAELDLHLSNVNDRAATRAGAAEIRANLKERYSVTERELAFLGKKGYTLAEIQYLALLARKSGKNINDVAAMHSRGIGWGVLAKRLGVHPGDLNKLIVKQKKAEKMMIKTSAPEAPRIKEGPKPGKGHKR